MAEDRVSRAQARGRGRVGARLTPTFTALTPLLLVLAGVGCGAGPAGPLDVAVVSPETRGPDALVQLRVGRLPEVEDLVQLYGPGVQLRVHSKIIFDYDELNRDLGAGVLNSVDDLREAVTRRAGRRPRAAFSLGSLGSAQGVWIPQDFHSLGMVTAYHHLVQARSVALASGMPATCLSSMPLFYEPLFEERSGGNLVRHKDNAMYVPLLGAFFVLAYDAFPTLPLSMNEGVMAHEYSHGVWGCLVEQSSPWPVREALLPAEAGALLSGINEGLADYWGAVVSEDPNFVSLSIPALETSRDLSIARLYTTAMSEDAKNAGEYDPYALGSVLASALWKLRGAVADAAQIDRVVLSTLLPLGRLLEARGLSGASFSLPDFLQLLVASASAQGRSIGDSMCNVLEDRFGILGALPKCGP